MTPTLSQQTDDYRGYTVLLQIRGPEADPDAEKTVRVSVHSVDPTVPFVGLGGDPDALTAWQELDVDSLEVERTSCELLEHARDWIDDKEATEAQASIIARAASESVFPSDEDGTGEDSAESDASSARSDGGDDPDGYPTEVYES